MWRNNLHAYESVYNRIDNTVITSMNGNMHIQRKRYMLVCFTEYLHNVYAVICNGSMLYA